jgi:hypothetical protein
MNFFSTTRKDISIRLFEEEVLCRLMYKVDYIFA